MAETRNMIVNMGPQHPATHGVLRLVLELDGETVVKVTPHLGHLHRGLEKLAETKTYHQALTLTDRMDYVGALLNNLGYTLAVEKLLGIEDQIPDRATVLRVALCELQRIASHLLWLASHALDIGAMTVLFYTFRDRETIMDLLEDVHGARLTPSYIRVGGLPQDVPPVFFEKARAFLKDFPSRMASASSARKSVSSTPSPGRCCGPPGSSGTCARLSPTAATRPTTSRFPRARWVTCTSGTWCG